MIGSGMPNSNSNMPFPTTSSFSVVKLTVRVRNVLFRTEFQR
jgi:hypothetical protein